MAVRDQVQVLLWRAGLGATTAQVDAATARGYPQAVENVLTFAGGAAGGGRRPARPDHHAQHDTRRSGAAHARRPPARRRQRRPEHRHPVPVPNTTFQIYITPTAFIPPAPAPGTYTLFGSITTNAAGAANFDNTVNVSIPAQKIAMLTVNFVRAGTAPQVAFNSKTLMPNTFCD